MSPRTFCLAAVCMLLGCSQREPVVDEGCEMWLDCCTFLCGTAAEAEAALPGLPYCKCFRVEGAQGDCLLEDDGTCDWHEF